jgi:hypothetical protein
VIGGLTTEAALAKKHWRRSFGFRSVDGLQVALRVGLLKARDLNLMAALSGERHSKIQFFKLSAITPQSR